MLRVDMGSLHSLLEELGDKAEAAARPAAQAAAQVLYDEAKKNVQAIGQKSGNLNRSIYQVYSKKLSGPGFATYHVSWNNQKAPHGYLLEFGHIQRYASYVGKDGRWHIAIRPGKKGKKAPWIGTGKNGRNRRATQAEMDAWYLPRPGGPVHWVGKAFLRRAFSLKQEAAAAAAKQVLQFHLNMNNYLPPG